MTPICCDMVSSVDGLAGAAAVGSSGAAAASRSYVRLRRGPDYSTTSITPHRQSDRIGFLLQRTLSAFGTKRTLRGRAAMSAFDPKRTFSLRIVAMKNGG